MTYPRLIPVPEPGRGRFLLSLIPYPGYAFEKAGTLNGFGLSFSWNGDRYELLTKKQITESSGNWNLYVLAARSKSADAGDRGFSYGEVTSVEQFLAKAQ